MPTAVFLNVPQLMGVFHEEVCTPKKNTHATLKLGVRGRDVSSVFHAWAFFMKTPESSRCVLVQKVCLHRYL